MSTRRFNEAEVAAIFQRATEAQPAGLTSDVSGDGMTLAQLQEIGREVGIPAESIALAARTIDQTRASASRTIFGLPVSVERTVYLERTMSEDEWERLVVVLRDTFNARGALKSQGSLRQWTNGNLQALLEPTATGHRIRLRTTKAVARTGLLFGSAVTLASMLALIVASVQGVADVLVPIGLTGVVGAALFARHAVGLPRWARTRKQQMDEIAARLAASAPDVATEHQ